MMFRNIALLLSAVTATAKSLTSGGIYEINAESQLGNHLLASARKLEGNEDFDNTWVTNYSVKFQGCHHVAQWNEEADGDEDVRIQTKRLVRFRLCPSGSCESTSAAGCKSGYGDYIIDMNIFVEAWLQAEMQDKEQTCENAANNCDCDEADDRDTCEYNCYINQGLDYCANLEEAEDFNVENYLECGQYQGDNDNNNGVEYYVGPYCAKQGGAIFLGLFTDDTCTTFADSNGGTSTFMNTFGSSLPYSSDSIVGYDCKSCMEPQDANEQNNGDAADEDEVRELCETIYENGGKCESGLSVQYRNEAACQFIEGVKIIRQDGVIETSSSRSSTTATVFIVLFAIAFALLGGYVYYLKTKLDRAKINLSSE